MGTGQYINGGAVTIDVEQMTMVGNALEKVHEKTGVSLHLLSLEVLMLTVQDLLKRTPPSSMKQGRNAISSDFGRIFTATPAPFIKAEWTGIYNGQLSHMYRNADDKVFAYPLDRYTTNEGELYSHHQSTRNSHTGRPYKNSGNVGTTQAAMRAYMAKVWKKVGSLKASWLPALDLLAPMVKKSPDVPAWIRAAGARDGSASVNTMDRLGNGYVSATNAMHYAVTRLASWVPSVMARRRRDLNYGMLKRADEIIQRFNGGTL